MKKEILDSRLPISQLADTIRILRNRGYNVISAELIAEEHRNKGFTIDADTVLKRICEAQHDLEIAYPLICMHPVSGYYLVEMPSFSAKVVGNCRIPPKSKWEDEIVGHAMYCLAIGQKTHGIRFPEGHTQDFLFSVWRTWNHRTVTRKMLFSAHKIAIGCTQGLITKKVAFNLMVSAVLSIRDGIDNPDGLPFQLGQIKEAVSRSLLDDWEQTFNKTQQGKYRL